jgi:hypothetical protein
VVLALAVTDEVGTSRYADVSGTRAARLMVACGEHA